MKKILLAIVVAVAGLFGLASCEETKVPTEPTQQATPQKKVFTVEFNTDGGSEVAAVEVNEGEKLTLPANPTKEGFVFAGWYTDEAFTTELSALAFPKKNTTAYAKWQVADTTTEYVVDGFNLLDAGSYAIAHNEDGSTTYTCVDRELNIQKLVGWKYSAYLHGTTGADLVDAEDKLVYTKLVAVVQGTKDEEVI